MSANPNKLKIWFDGLKPAQKRNVVVGGILVGVLLAILLSVAATNDPKPVQAHRGKKIETSILTGKDPSKVGMEQIAAEQKRITAMQEQQARELAALRNQVAPGSGRVAAGGSPFNPSAGGDVVNLPGGAPVDTTIRRGGGSVNSSPVQPVKAPPQAVADATNPSSAQGGGRGPAAQQRGPQPPAPGLPPPNIPGVTDNSDVYGAADGDPQPVPVVEPPPPRKLELKILKPAANSPSSAKLADSAPAASANATFVNPTGANPRAYSAGGRPGQAQPPRDPDFYLPLGSIISGTLMTGVDAPASGQAARKDPHPALLRVKHEAILPNSSLLDLRECFLIASSYGDLSAERVHLRAEGLSCVRSDGAILETPLDAFASGSDGKSGVRGRVVEKTGQLIARALVAGFVEGLAKGFKPTQSQPISINPSEGGTASFQYPSADYVIGSGLLAGASNAASRISDVYADLAKQVVPVVEINAGIPVDFILVRGAVLRFKRVGEIAQAGRAASSGQGQAQSGPLPNAFSVTPGSGSSTPPPQPTGPSTLIPSAPRR